jgi:hypothetical protein
MTPEDHEFFNKSFLGVAWLLLLIWASLIFVIVVAGMGCHA